MAPRPRRRGPGPIDGPSATDRSIAKSQEPVRQLGPAASSNRVRRAAPLNPVQGALGFDVDRDALVELYTRQLTPAGKQMMTPEPNLGKSTQLNRDRSYSTSMAANMDAYFRRMMAQTSPNAPAGGGVHAPTRYPETDYGDIDQNQQQFRELQRQAMMRTMARQILEGGQPSTAQMMKRSYDEGFPASGGYRGNGVDIADTPIDPIFGQQDRRQYPDGERYYEAGNIDTLADALAERRDLAPSTQPAWMATQQWNRGRRPFSPGVTQRYQP